MIDKNAIKALFNNSERCTLLARTKLNGQFQEMVSGDFATILTLYYLNPPWNRLYIRLANGAHYPKDYRK